MQIAPEISQPGTESSGSLAPPGARKALAGFFVSGLLLGLLGAVLLAWQQHLLSDYLTVGWYFAGLIAGVLSSVWIAPRLLEKKGVGWMLSAACAAASAGLLYLAFFSPPFAPWWRIAGLVVIGCSAGVLQTAIFQAISPMYRHDPAATVNLAGILFGLGCLTVSLVVSRTFYVYTAPSIQIWIAVIPAMFAIGYARTRFTKQPVPSPPPAQAILAEFRSPGAILLSLLLFFQFGNEWAVAGWLPLFLSQRLGISPATSILMLALYWLALLIGRVVAQWAMPRMRHSHLLLTAVLVSMFACLVLIATDNLFGAATGVLLLGGAFAPVYPLLVEKIGKRFPYYHPGFYNGIFSFAIAGGLLAPCTLGFFAWLLGVRAVMALPLAGSVIVFLLLSLIWLEARLNAMVKSSR